MGQQARDSYLKNPPNSTNFSKLVARLRMKGFHEDMLKGNELDASAVYLVDPTMTSILSSNRVTPGGVPMWYADRTLNSSDKTITVPAGEQWDVRELSATISATVTVGSRALVVLISDPNAVLVWVGPILANVVASAVGTMRLVGATTINTTARRNNFDGVGTSGVQVTDVLPSPMSLMPGYTIRIYDAGAVDVNADDLYILMHYIRYPA